MVITDKKKLTIMALALVVAFAIGIGWTLAYFHDEQQVVNPFTVAGNPSSSPDTGLNIDLTEPHWNIDKAQNMVPGDVVPKDPTVTNTLDISYVRFIVQLTDSDGTPITDPVRAAKIMSMIYYKVPDLTSKIDSAGLAALQRINPEFAPDTTRGGVGVYYYNYIGDGTPAGAIMQHADVKTLFTGVAVPTEWTQADIDKIGNFNIVVNAQAIQAQNFTDATEAFAALDVEEANVSSSAPSASASAAVPSASASAATPSASTAPSTMPTQVATIAPATT